MNIKTSRIMKLVQQCIGAACIVDMVTTTRSPGLGCLSKAWEPVSCAQSLKGSIVLFIVARVEWPGRGRRVHFDYFLWRVNQSVYALYPGVLLQQRASPWVLLDHVVKRTAQSKCSTPPLWRHHVSTPSVYLIYSRPLPSSSRPNLTPFRLVHPSVLALPNSSWY